jgi:hypothetical protein
MAGPNTSPAESVKKPQAQQKTNTRSSSQAGVAESQTTEISGQITVRTTSALSTKTNQAGQTFEASLEQPVLSGGRQVLPKGTPVIGKITDVDPGGRVRGRATISVELTGVQAGGRVVAIATDTFVREAPATKKKDAAKVGIGAGIGAAIGAIAGGAKGAAIGAGAEGGAGTAAVLATRGDPAEIPSEAVLTFKLARPVKLPAR